MHELPEVHIYREMLTERFAGALITGFEVTNDKIISPSKESLSRDVVGKTLWFIERRGKYLLFHLDNGKRLVMHMGSGAYLYQGTDIDKPSRQAHAKIYFGERIMYLVGHRANEIQLLSVKEVEEQFEGIGPDPMASKLTLERFIARFAKKRGTIKSSLMDQIVIAGLGAVYSDEICFAAGVRPDAKIPQIEAGTWARLYDSMHSLIKEAISKGGTGTQPFAEGDTFTGGYTDQLQVFNREGQTCRLSGDIIERIDISGKKAYVCPGCQKS